MRKSGIFGAERTILQGGEDIRADYLSADEVAHLMKWLKPTTARVCALMMTTGLRVGDVVDLPTSKLSQRMTVREKKTGKTRRVYIRRALYADLKRNAGSVWLFPSRDGHITRQTVYNHIKRAVRSSGVNKNATPHSFRKVYAVTKYHRYGLATTARLLNHDNITTTLLYCLADQVKI